ncbi:MAG: TonB-dependent receptor plug domain-containing protein, partial [Prevotella sp.]|nr:TonB-dependent receptor plug domain-containing protein [Prevotella sp.]
MVRKNYFSAMILLITLLLSGILYPQSVKAQNKSRIYGTVYELDGKKSVPLDFATVSFPDFSIGTTTNNGGSYSLNVPQGKVKMRVQYVGKHAIDTLVNVKGDMRLNFTLLNEDFRLQEVTVTATHNAAGSSTSSNISRQAMEHMQATSLYDIMALLPGGITSEQNLSQTKTMTLRQSGTRNTATNSLGTAIIRDGAPISNNANLSILNTAFVSEDNGGKIGGIAGTTSPSEGVDLRTISTENIENVEVIRGIPSVEYGDLTSGAVIIHSKAGREPLRIKAKANPKVYQGSIGTGFELG